MDTTDYIALGVIGAALIVTLLAANDANATLTTGDVTDTLSSIAAPILNPILTGVSQVTGNLTRGLRNNNPGNIRKGAAWLGLDPNGTDQDYCTFVSMAYGCRAMAVTLNTYITRDGVPRTVRGIINRWAPPSENNTSAYVSDVAGQLGVGPDDPLYFPADFDPLIHAITRHENGYDPLDDSDVQSGIALA